MTNPHKRQGKHQRHLPAVQIAGNPATGTWPLLFHGGSVIDDE